MGGGNLTLSQSAHEWGRRGGKQGKEKRENKECGTIHSALIRDAAKKLLVLFLYFLLAVSHAAHAFPCVPSPLISLTLAVHLHSPGTAPDIWRGVKSNVLSGVFTQELEANTEIFNAEHSLGRLAFAEKEVTSMKEMGGKAK